MFIEYDDILARVAAPPVWWLSGVPRFERFCPKDVGVYSREVALVHTECQACRTRYDVAIEPRGYGRDLRSMIAYTTSLDVGDPPNACHSKAGCTGSVMNSLEIAILEYWRKDDVLRGWERDSTAERPLIDADWDKKGEAPISEPVFLRIHHSGEKEKWAKARNDGDFAAMVSILISFGCERAREVAYMLDIERREKEFVAEISTLRKDRFGLA